jgi:hypothetical protein
LTVKVLWERTIIDIICRIYSPVFSGNISRNKLLSKRFPYDQHLREDFYHRIRTSA